MTDFRVFVTGSRTWADCWTVGAALNTAAVDASASGADAMVVVHGGAQGADRIAHLWCVTNPAAHALGRTIRVVEEVYLPDWSGLGKGAGFIRNQRMANSSIDLCLAFIKDNSRGATHALGCAEVAGVLARVWRV